MALRLATREDIPSLVPLLYAFHAESPYSNVPFDAEKVFALAESFTVSDPDKIAIVLDFHGTNVGFVFGQVHEVLFGKSRIASELAWYVVEGFRKGLSGAKLQRAFEYWAEHVVKADIIHMACLEGKYREKLEKNFKKRGYTCSELTYIKEINGSS